MIETAGASSPVGSVRTAPPGVATDTSIATYLAAGDRARALAGSFAVACVVLIALLMLTWAMGLLPAAVRLVL